MINHRHSTWPACWRSPHGVPRYPVGSGWTGGLTAGLGGLDFMREVTGEAAVKHAGRVRPQGVCCSVGLVVVAAGIDGWGLVADRTVHGTLRY